MPESLLPLLVSGLLAACSMASSSWFVSSSHDHHTSHGFLRTTQCVGGSCATMHFECSTGAFCLILVAFRVVAIVATVFAPLAIYSAFLATSLLSRRECTRTMRLTILQLQSTLIASLACLQLGAVSLFLFFRILAARNYFDIFATFESRFGISFWLMVGAGCSCLISLASVILALEDARLGRDRSHQTQHGPLVSSPKWDGAYALTFSFERGFEQEALFYEAVPV